MTEIAIRRFNASAVEKLHLTLIALSNGSADLDSLGAFLFEDGLTEVLEPEIMLDPSKFAGITSKYEFGKIFAKQVGEEDVRRLLADDDAWPWLSLLFRETLIPRKENGFYVGDLSRHMIVTLGGRNNKARHRHLVRGAVNAVHRFGELAAGLMDDVTSHTTFEEQIMSRTERQRLAASVEFVRAVNLLYWDKKKKRHRKGAAGGKLGSMRRLIEIVHQLEANYSVASLTAEELMALLPKREFKAFLPQPSK